jgi:AraC-like DNA-binding protein
LFADLRQINRGEFIAENPERHLQGARLPIVRSQGHGTWELYRLDQEFYFVAMSGVFDSPCVEVAPGEGLVEFHLRLSGVLEMLLPGSLSPVTVTGPKLMMMYQPPGVQICERLLPRHQDASVTLFCKPQILAELARRNGIDQWPLLEEIDKTAHDRVWYRQVELSPTLLYLGTSLLDCPYGRGIRLLYAEAKALELLCEVLALTQASAIEAEPKALCGKEARQLEEARRMLGSHLSDPVHISDIACAIGMSESKLKRVFKARYGVTIFEYGIERRMQHAMELLRCRQMPVGQVAHSVGYRHQTSFAAAFRDFFGFLPSKARTEIH